MSLPTYDKNKRRKSFEQLPKGAYVVKILYAREDEWPSKDKYLKLGIDIAEGEYAGFFQKIYDNNKSEDRKWPIDGYFNLNVPNDNSKDYVWTNWNSFFADLEDSNNGFRFNGDLATLKNKLIGGKFRIEQSEYNGKIYDHTRMNWTCVAEDVRQGKAGQMPQDKLKTPSRQPSGGSGTEDFMNIPEGIEEELPFA